MLSALVTFPGMPRKPLPLSEKRVQVGARVEPSLIAALQSLADNDRRTLSFMVEEAIREYVARHSGGGDPRLGQRGKR